MLENAPFHEYMTVMLDRETYQRKRTKANISSPLSIIGLMDPVASDDVSIYTCLVVKVSCSSLKVETGRHPPSMLCQLATDRNIDRNFLGCS